MGCERDFSADTEVSEEVRGRRSAGGGGAPAAHESKWWSRSPFAAQGAPHAGAGGCPRNGCDSMGKPVLEQASGRNCDPMGDLRWSSLFLKD